MLEVIRYRQIAMKNNDFKLDEYRIKELLYNDHFLDDVKELRAVHRIPPVGFKTTLETNKWYDALSDSEKDLYERDLELLLSNFSLGFKWRFGVRLFIETGNEKMIRAQNNWGLTYSYSGTSDSPKILRAVKIELDPQTTLKDIKEAYDAAQKLFKKAGMKKKIQYVENIDRDFQVYKKYKNKTPSSEILGWLNDNYPGSFNGDSLKKIIIRAKKRFGKRHPWLK